MFVTGVQCEVDDFRGFSAELRYRVFRFLNLIRRVGLHRYEYSAFFDVGNAELRQHVESRDGSRDRDVVLFAVIRVV